MAVKNKGTKTDSVVSVTPEQLLKNGRDITYLKKLKYSDAQIKAACKKINNPTSLIKKELKNKTGYKNVSKIFTKDQIKKAAGTKSTASTFKTLLKAGATANDLKSLGYDVTQKTESNTGLYSYALVDACLSIKSGSSDKEKVKYTLTTTKGAIPEKEVDRVLSGKIKNYDEVKKEANKKSNNKKDHHGVSLESNKSEKSDTSFRGDNLFDRLAEHYGTSAKNEKTTYNHMRRANFMIYDDHRLWDSKFNRMQYPNPWISVPNTREYLFFTKPDLHIVDVKTKGLRKELRYSSFWREEFARYRRIISDLQVSARRTSETYNHKTSGKEYYIAHDRHVFIPLLTNAVSSTLEMPSSSADTSDTPQTINGTSIQYRKSSTKSDEGYDFSLDFIDAPWLDVYHFFKMWDEYETLKDLGYIGPPQFTAKDNEQTTGYYRINKILHDQIAIYKFVVDGSDMETILFYAKFIGCFPKSVPRDAFSSFKGEGNISYSVDWHAQFVDDMNPNILFEFNELCYSYFSAVPNGKSKFKYIPPYSTNYNEPNGGFRRHPYIVEADAVDAPNSIRYLLRWFD